MFCLRLGSIYRFFAFRGLFCLGYILGLVTVLYSSGFLGFRVLLLLGFARFYYGWVVFSVFMRLEVFFLRVYLWFSYGFIMLRFFRVKSSFAPSVGQVCLLLGRV